MIKGLAREPAGLVILGQVALLTVFSATVGIVEKGLRSILVVALATEAGADQGMFKQRAFPIRCRSRLLGAARPQGYAKNQKNAPVDDLQDVTPFVRVRRISYQSQSRGFGEI